MLAKKGRAVLWGMPGMGKTQLAISYLRTCRQTPVICLTCSRRELFEQSLRDYFQKTALRFTGPSIAAESAVMGESHSLMRRFAWTLENMRGYLILFDDVGDRALFDYIAGLPANGQYLITTREPYAANVADTLLAMDGASPALAAKILQAWAPVLRDAAHAGTVKDLCRFCGSIPLALVQAASFLRVTGMEPEAYLAQLQSGAPLRDVLGEGQIPAFSQRVHPGICQTYASLYRCFVKSAAMETAGAQAVTILRYCAVLHPGWIAESFLQRLDGVAKDGVRFEEALYLLRRHSLLERGGGKLLLKAVVQHVLRDLFSNEDLSPCFIQIGNHLQDTIVRAGILRYGLLDAGETLHHARGILDNGAARVLDGQCTARLYAYLGLYNLEIGELSAAERDFHESDHYGNVPEACLGAASLYEGLERYQSALQAVNRADASQKRKYGGADALAMRLRILQIKAYIEEDLHRYKAAEKLLKKAEALLQKAPLADVRAAAELRIQFWNSRGNLLCEQGLPERAENAYRMALDLGERFFTAPQRQSPGYVWAYGNRAEAARKRGDAQTALKLLRRQRKLFYEIYGRRPHAEVANNLFQTGALLYETKGKRVNRGAAIYLEAALRMLDAVDCRNSSLPLVIKCSYAALKADRDDFEGARKLYNEALGSLESMMQSPLRSHLMRDVLLELGKLHFNTGDFHTARQYLKQAARYPSAKHGTGWKLWVGCLICLLYEKSIEHE